MKIVDLLGEKFRFETEAGKYELNIEEGKYGPDEGKVQITVDFFGGNYKNSPVCIFNETYITESFFPSDIIKDLFYQRLENVAEKIIHYLLEETYGLCATFTNDEIKKLDPDLVYDVLDRMRDFVSDPYNNATKEDLESWERDGFLVLLSIEKNGFGVTAGQTSAELSNQPTWFTWEYEYMDTQQIADILSAILAKN